MQGTRFNPLWNLTFRMPCSQKIKKKTSFFSYLLFLTFFLGGSCYMVLRVPWTAKRSNHSILKQIKSECSLEGLRLKLKLQYFRHLMQRANSLEKTLMLGKTEGRRRRRWPRMRWFDDITDSKNMSLSRFWETAKDREAWRAAVHGVAKSRIGLSNWTTTWFVGS